MNVQPLTAEQWWLVAAVLAALFVISWTFNAWIDMVTDNDTEGAGSYFWVVFGVSYTLVGIGLVLIIAFDAQVAMLVMATALVCFAASGLPMIFGDMRRNARHREAYHRQIEQRAHEQTELQIKDLGL